MLSIGNKKYRNLQEQVGFNTEQIEKIFDVLDGLAVTDNVVAIADLSDNLNADQLEIVQKSVAFLVYDGQLYIKRSEDASNAYFDIVFTISSSGGVISFDSKEIEIVLATGSLSQTTSTNSTYSSTQIDTKLSAKSDITYVDAQLALKANLAGANFTGAITAPSIIEDMSGYAITYIDSVVDPIYVGIVKNGNKLTIVTYFKITASATSMAGIWFGLQIPASVGAKLNPTLVGENYWIDFRKIDAFSGATTHVDAYARIRKDSNTSLAIVFSGSNYVVSTEYIMRYEATFLLSDNLAQ